ncbi:Putative hypothetical protein [Helicobacter mustelae 12198]|uniref:Uncharacterized protein n=1 Tax=Helicobacter mustelae (strain ATCC 43772 / CCUG 25715 / CIP 103759 / LMG 18044 / NCTC 12198 / R85-136P) TaxID=679897 RepID=D3UG66_HELM1|nr:Putative hypothetical protein [Helicobacter mustelae 12198]
MHSLNFPIKSKTFDVFAPKFSQLRLAWIFDVLVPLCFAIESIPSMHQVL